MWTNQSWDYIKSCMNCQILFLPIVLTEPGNYKTRGGETVSITSISSNKFETWCFGAYSNGIKDSWYPCGRILRGKNPRTIL